MSGAGRATVHRPPVGGSIAEKRGVSNVGRRKGLSPPLRKLVLAAHVVVSVGWFGVVAAMLVLEISAAAAQDVAMSRAAYALVEDISDTLLAPPPATFGLAALLTGVVLSLGTRWGLFKHYWILAKLVLTVAVILSGIFLVDRWIQQSVANASSGSAPMLLICASAAHLIMLGAATILSVYKPRGTTGRGRGDAVPRGPIRRIGGGARIAPGVQAPGENAVDA